MFRTIDLEIKMEQPYSCREGLPYMIALLLKDKPMKPMDYKKTYWRKISSNVFLKVARQALR